jgi:beta-glucosidase
MTPFDDASTRVAAGADAHTEASALVALMTDDEKLWCLDGDQPFWAGMAHLGTGGYHRRTFPAGRVERLGIPGFAFSDGPRGVVIGPATCFPVSMARGASFDPDLEERIGDAIGRELVAVGASLYGGVCVNLLRHPGWGRAQETYGEEPHHVGEMGAALARGVQRHVMACVKHFACNSMENARFKVDVRADERALHEVYLPHFRRVVDEGVAVVMTAYNAVNGEWCGESPALLADVLRGEWGFEGFVISDWIFGLRDGPQSVAAGLDVEMPYRMVRAVQVPGALADGTLAWSDVDAAVTRVLATLLRFPARPHDRLDGAALATAEHRALAREAAARSMVLLRNEPVDGHPLLPLDASSLRVVAVLGRLAAVANLGDGGSSEVLAPDVVTPLDGLRASLPGVEVRHHDHDPTVVDGADVVVVVVGLTKQDEGEYIAPEGTAHLRHLLPPADDPALAAAFQAAASGEEIGERPTFFSTGGDRRSLRLSPEDEALVLAAAAAHRRVVVAVMAGSAVVTEAWRQAVPALLLTWYPGMEGGHALADVLLGREEPGGRLPFVVPTAETHLPRFDPDADAETYGLLHGQWLLDASGHRAAYPFGYGLGYATPSIEGVEVEADGTDLVVRATVRNTGARAGTEVVQVYAGLPTSRVIRPRRRLVGFARVDVAAGEAVAVAVPCSLQTLAVRQDGGWWMEPGTYEVAVGRHAADPSATVAHVTVTG